MRWSAILVLVVASLGAVAQVAPTPPPPVAPQMRHTVTPERVRVVVDLPAGEIAHQDASTPAQVMVTLDLPLARALAPLASGDPIAATATLAPDAAGKAVLTIPLARPRKALVSRLPAEADRPARLVVDILKRFREESARTLNPATTYRRIEEQTDDRYGMTHILVADTRDPRVRLRAVANATGRERVGDMVTRTGAVAGVNAGFFLTGVRPVGLLKTDGRVLSMPIWGRTAVAFPMTGAPTFGNPAGFWRVTLPDGTVREAPDWFDARHATPSPTLSVVNGSTLAATPANADGVTLMLRNGMVVSAAYGPGAMPLEPGQLALVLRGEDVARLAPTLGATARIAIEPVLPDTPWMEVASAVGAGPRLLRAGQPVNTGEAERFQPDVLRGRVGRTAMGVTADGRVVLVVVEPPGPYGGGATLEDLAALLQANGAVDGMNFDGGGSSTMALGAETVTAPPGAFIRPVASAVVVEWTAE